MRQRGSGVLHQRRRSRVVLPDRERRAGVASAGPDQTGMRCRVRTPCLEWALASGKEAGVWGGASEPERRALRRMRRTPVDGGTDMTATISDSSSRAHGRGKPSARSGGECAAGEICDVVARPQPGQGDRPATAVPFLDVPAALRVRVLAAFLLGVIARDRLGDPGAAGCALQRALDLAEPDQVPCPFLIHPPTRLLDRQVRRRSAAWTGWPRHPANRRTTSRPFPTARSGCCVTCRRTCPHGRSSASCTYR
jgi:hypothetical protein